MRSTLRRAGGPGIALVCLLLLPQMVFAEPARGVKRRSVASCASFTQVEHGDDGVDLSIDNRCDMALTCHMRWALTCAPDTKHRRRSRASLQVAIATATSETRTASAAECGGEGWVIDDVVWGCAPARD